jgi:hypothetical protein
LEENYLGKMMNVKIFLLLFCASVSVVAQNVTTSVTSSTSSVISNGTTTPISSTSTTTPKPTETTTKKTTTTTPPPPAPLEESTTTTHKPKALKLGPVVTTKSGQLRPLVLTSRKGREYYAFRGVPYATPPINFQRFKVDLYGAIGIIIIILKLFF